ncbi:hypothetical protein PQR57_38140, partial [Paraburkholderia dipogonis]
MINGVENQDLQSSTRYGITLSVPLAAQWSTKLAWSRGLTTRIGGNFQTVAVALQYRWFNRWLTWKHLCSPLFAPRLVRFYKDLQRAGQRLGLVPRQRTVAARSNATAPWARRDGWSWSCPGFANGLQRGLQCS